jgi:hypothetical protein
MVQWGMLDSRQFCTEMTDKAVVLYRHKDYIFQRKLAERLPIDSFRLDFR